MVSDQIDGRFSRPLAAAAYETGVA